MKPYLFAVVLLLAGRHVCRSENPLPEKWQPDLDYVHDFLADELEGAPQQRLNSVTGRMAMVRDAQLQIVYLELYVALPVGKRSALKREQAAWLKYRDEEEDRVTPKDSERGTIAPMEENDRSMELTEQRIKKLKKRLDVLK